VHININDANYSAVQVWNNIDGAGTAQMKIYSDDVSSPLIEGAEWVKAKVLSMEEAVNNFWGCSRLGD
jgi:IS5 family transposase